MLLYQGQAYSNKEGYLTGFPACAGMTVLFITARKGGDVNSRRCLQRAGYPGIKKNLDSLCDLCVLCGITNLRINNILRG